MTQRKRKNQLPKLICFTGVDGSGKTLFAKKLIEELNEIRVPAKYVWLRFMNITSKPLLALCRLSGLSYYEEQEGIKIGYHEFQKSKIISWLFIIFQLLDVWLVTISKLWIHILSGQIVVCDRGSYDTLIDVMVDTKKLRLSGSRIGKAFLLFLPKSHLVLHISRSRKKILKNRPDVAFDRNFELRCRMYSTCAYHFKWTAIENNSAIGETMGQIKHALELT